MEAVAIRPIHAITDLIHQISQVAYVVHLVPPELPRLFDV
jgi:hypothetical protein